MLQKDAVWVIAQAGCNKGQVTNDTFWILRKDRNSDQGKPLGAAWEGPPDPGGSNGCGGTQWIQEGGAPPGELILGGRRDATSLSSSEAESELYQMRRDEQRLTG